MAISHHRHNTHRMSLLRQRTTMKAVSIDCDFAEVEEFICHVVPEYSSQRRQLVSAIVSQVRGLHNRVHVNGVAGSYEDLWNAITVLEEFLNVSTDLPPSITCYVHTFIGQIKAAQNDASDAALSFTKALWIASFSDDISDEQRAAALQRMGQVYAQGRHYLQARDVLRKAVETYKAAGISNHHVQEARRLLDETERKWKESEESWSSLRLSQGSRLTQILE